MNPTLTRDQLLRRGAAGVAFLSLPSLLAACGGGGGGDDAGGELNDVLNFSNWELYIDTPDTRKAAGLTGPTTLQQFTQGRCVELLGFGRGNGPTVRRTLGERRNSEGRGQGSVACYRLAHHATEQHAKGDGHGGRSFG